MSKVEMMSFRRLIHNGDMLWSYTRKDESADSGAWGRFRAKRNMAIYGSTNLATTSDARHARH